MDLVNTFLLLRRKILSETGIVLNMHGYKTTDEGMLDSEYDFIDNVIIFRHLAKEPRESFMKRVAFNVTSQTNKHQLFT